MKYPFITMINKFKNQFIIEGCSENDNFKIIITYSNLFDEENIEIKKVEKNQKKGILTFFELSNFYEINFNTALKLYKLIY